MNELFTYGEHHATETVEQGDRNLGKEKSNGIDTTHCLARWKNYIVC